MPARGTGLRQRLGVPGAEPSNARERSHTAGFLAETYRSRILNSRLVAAAANASVLDNPTAASSTRRLARCHVTKKRKTNSGERPDNRNASRGVSRAMRASSSARLPEPYEFDCPLWDDINCCAVVEKVAILLPHELIDSQIEPGEEEEWCSLNDSQGEFHDDISAWSARTGVSLDGQNVAGGALWGDAAPYSLKDSIYLLILTILIQKTKHDQALRPSSHSM